MAERDVYEGQVRLLVSVLPLLADFPVFALKGGTAINLFVRDLPRLSVDIDLAFVPVASREESLAAIDTNLKGLAAAIRATNPRVRVFERVSTEGHVEKLGVEADGARIKVEVTPVLRGTVYDPVTMSVQEKVEATYGFAETLVVSLPDLYAGKLVAALDRQHPRDLYDVQLLLANEGVDDRLRDAFVAYLLSSAKPLNTIVAPTRKDLAKVYEQEFVGMANEDVSLESLLAIREEMIAKMFGEMPEAHREFLVSFKAGQPDWSLVAVPGMKDLPAVKFREQKLAALDPDARAKQLEKLKRVLTEARGNRERS